MINISFIIVLSTCFVLSIFSLLSASNFGGSSMVYALLFGIAIRSFIHKGDYIKGIDFIAKKILRLGVAFLGVRITFGEIFALGWEVVLIILLGVVLTIFFGFFCSKLLGLEGRMGILTGGASAVCGASAAMAISSVYPQEKKLEEQTLFTVIGVNALSTIAMVIYPIIVKYFNFNDIQAGVFLGGSIHDVAQVVGAGLTISDEVGNIATISKLLRVATLLPIVSILGFWIFWKNKKQSQKTSVPFPMFLIGFLFCVSLNSFGFLSFELPIINLEMNKSLSYLSKMLLTMSIVALGIKTNLKSLFGIGQKSILLLVLEMFFIAFLVGSLVFFL